jgi:hypothetical protein
MRKVWLAAPAALVTAFVIGSPAYASTCSGAASQFATIQNSGTTVSTPTVATSCTVDGLTFSNITINLVGTILGLTFTPVITTSETGIDLTFSDMGTSADVNWTYVVAGSNITDAVGSVTGTASGGGVVSLGESLSNPNTLQQFASLSCSSTTGSCSASANFSAVNSLFADKDQADIPGNGIATSSSIINAFSVSTPLPGALPLFATGLLGFWGVRKRRSKQNSTAAA